MDKYVLDQNFEKFKAKRIHLDNHSIKKIGIIGNQTVLKINDFHLYCVPYDLGLKMCNILIVLDAKEIEFFTVSFNKIHSIHFVFQSPHYKKPISLFIRCKIINLKVMNPDTNHCIVSLEYTVIPNDYKEILINLFKRNEALEYLFNNEQFRNKKVERTGLKFANIDDSIHLRTENGSEPIKMIIIHCSMLMIRLIGDDQQKSYKVNQRVQVEVFSKDNSFFVNGTVVSNNSSGEIPGYSIIEIKMEFSSFLTDQLYLSFKKKSDAAAKAKAQ